LKTEMARDSQVEVFGETKAVQPAPTSIPAKESRPISTPISTPNPKRP
jgi:hypothetical protein